MTGVVRRAVRLACFVAAATAARVAAQPVRPAAAPAPSRAAGAMTARADGTSDSTAGGVPVLLTVNVGRAASGNVFGLEVGPALLLSAKDFLRLAGVGASQRGARVTADLPSVDASLEIDGASRRLRVGRRRFVAAPGQVRHVGGTVYVALSVLDRLLGVRATYRPEDAVVDVEDPGVLPVTRRAQHVAMREAAAVSASVRAAAASRTAARQTAEYGGRASGVVLDYDLLRWGALLPVGPRGPARGSAGIGEVVGSVGLAVPAGPGVATVRTTADGVHRWRASALDAGWRWDHPDGRLLRSVWVGDGSATSLRSYGVRGLSLSNAPLAPEMASAWTTVAGSVPAGWAVEAYQAGTLLAIDSAAFGRPEPDGPDTPAAGGGDTTAAPGPARGGVDPNARTRRYALAVPLHGGLTTLDLVAVGPRGELRPIPRMVHRPPMTVAPGALEYRVAAGACNARDLPTDADARACRARANGDVRYGVSSRLAVRGGVDGLWRDGVGRRWQPYAAVSATPWDPVVLEAEDAPRQYDHWSVRLQPSPAWFLGADRVLARPVWRSSAAPAAAFDSSDDARRIGALMLPDAAVTQSTVQAHLAPALLRGAAVEVQASDAAWVGGRWREQRLGLALPGSGVDWRPYLRRDASTNGAARVLVGSTGTWLARGRAAQALGPAWVTHDVEFTTAGTPWRAELGIAHPAGHSWRFDATAQWDRATGRVHGVLGIVSQRPSVRVSTQTRVTSGAPGAVTTQAVTGSAVWDPVARRVMLSADRAVDRGGIVGTVFLDLDGDGRRGPRDPAIPGVHLAVETRAVESDARGHYHVLGLAPGAVVSLAVDSSSLSSPWWTPAHAVTTVRVPAGGLRTFDVPVTLAAVVEGRVVARGTPLLPPRLRVTLRSAADGEPRDAEVFADGTFTLSGIAPGRYTVVASTPAAGWRFAPLELDVPPGVPADTARPLDAQGATLRDVQVVAYAPEGGVDRRLAAAPAAAEPAGEPSARAPDRGTSVRRDTIPGAARPPALAACVRVGAAAARRTRHGARRGPARHAHRAVHHGAAHHGAARRALGRVPGPAAAHASPRARSHDTSTHAPRSDRRRPRRAGKPSSGRGCAPAADTSF